MKAKEYADVFISAVDKALESRNAAIVEKAIDLAAGNAVTAFMKEGLEIARIRKVQFDPAVIAIFDELIDKWRAFADIVNTKYKITVIKPDGFKHYIWQKFPDVKAKLN
jgi:hypothetical protein